MIQMQTNLDVADNFRRPSCYVHQGAGGSRAENMPPVGDIIVVSVKEAIPRGRVKKGRCDEGGRGTHGQGHSPAPTAA